MIDLNSPITFQNGAGEDFNLNTLIGTQYVAGGSTPLSGYIVSGFGLGGLQPIGYEDPKAVRDGIDTAEAFAGRRIVTLNIDVYGSTRADLFQRVQNLINLMRFTPKRYEVTDGFRLLKATMLSTDVNFDGEIPIQFLARPLTIPQSESNSTQFTGADGLGYSQRVAIYFLLKYPYKYAQQLNEINIPINNTDVEVPNHGGAPAEFQVLIEATSVQATDIKITINVNDVPITLNVTETLGLFDTIDDVDYTRSILVDYNNQIVYTNIYESETLTTNSEVTMNLIGVDSGAMFATLEPNSDSGESNRIRVRIQNASTLADITSNYVVTTYWREAWY